jgi:hypothetical protein
MQSKVYFIRNLVVSIEKWIFILKTSASTSIPNCAPEEAGKFLMEFWCLYNSQTRHLIGSFCFLDQSEALFCSLDQSEAFFAELIIHNSVSIFKRCGRIANFLKKINLILTKVLWNWLQIAERRTAFSPRKRPKQSGGKIHRFLLWKRAFFVSRRNCTKHKRS